MMIGLVKIEEFIEFRPKSSNLTSPDFTALLMIMLAILKKKDHKKKTDENRRKFSDFVFGPLVGKESSQLPMSIPGSPISISGNHTSYFEGVLSVLRL